MSHYIETLTLGQNLTRLAYRSQAPLANVMVDSATWILTGTAAIIGAIIVSLSSVVTVVDENSLKWGIIWLVISMLGGCFAKQSGAVFVQGMASADQMYVAIASQPYSQSTDRFPDNLGDEIASGYLFPLTYAIKRGFKNGSEDPLFAEKRLMKIFSITIFLSWIQSGAGATGLIVMAIGMT